MEPQKMMNDGLLQMNFPLTKKNDDFSVFM